MIAAVSSWLSAEVEMPSWRAPQINAYRKKASEIIRAYLFERLGCKCAIHENPDECGGRLVFDHPHGRNYQPNRLDRLQRARRYLDDFRAGNLRLVCEEWNERDGLRKGNEIERMRRIANGAGRRKDTAAT